MLEHILENTLTEEDKAHILPYYTDREVAIMNYLKIIYNSTDFSEHLIDIMIGKIYKKSNTGSTSPCFGRCYLQPQQHNIPTIFLSMDLFKVFKPTKTKKNTLKNAENMSQLIETFIHEITHILEVQHNTDFYIYDIIEIKKYMVGVILGKIPPFTLNFFETGKSKEIEQITKNIVSNLHIRYAEQSKTIVYLITLNNGKDYLGNAQYILNILAKTFRIQRFVLTKRDSPRHVLIRLLNDGKIKKMVIYKNGEVIT